MQISHIVSQISLYYHFESETFHFYSLQYLNIHSFICSYKYELCLLKKKSQQSNHKVQESDSIYLRSSIYCIENCPRLCTDTHKHTVKNVRKERDDEEW